MDPQPECGRDEVPKIPSYLELYQLVLNLQAELAEAKEIIRTQAERIRYLEEENKILKKKLYGSHSERRPKQSKGNSRGPSKGPRQTRVRPLTEQYPDAPVEDHYVSLDTLPQCQCCQGLMVDSGLREITEQLHTVPAKHKIVRQHRTKYKCPKCYLGLITAPQPARIAPGSSLGDSFIIEAAIAKFYHLIPAERYAGMVANCGFAAFAPQLVLAAHHYLADFLRPIYALLKKSIQKVPVLHADETPHRMLEGSDTKNWFLWGFCSPEGYYYELHPTRSGDVASKFLANSKCKHLMSDIYTGYGKAIREANLIRISTGLSQIVPLSCNAHSRRRFVEASIAYPDESQFFIDQYEQIYRLEAELKKIRDYQSRVEKRVEMRPYYEAMFMRAAKLQPDYPDRSSLVSAILYFTKNYEGFTRFLDNPDLPIDNNIAERQLRNPVIGRKTWYGTHSEKGAETTEILFSVLQSCRYLKVNPRQYLWAVTHSMLNGKPPFTPSQYLADTPHAA